MLSLSQRIAFCHAQHDNSALCMHEWGIPRPTRIPKPLSTGSFTSTRTEASPLAPRGCLIDVQELEVVWHRLAAPIARVNHAVRAVQDGLKSLLNLTALTYFRTQIIIYKAVSIGILSPYYH